MLTAAAFASALERSPKLSKNLDQDAAPPDHLPLQSSPSSKTNGKRSNPPSSIRRKRSATGSDSQIQEVAAEIQRRLGRTITPAHRNTSPCSTDTDSSWPVKLASGNSHHMDKVAAEIQRRLRSSDFQETSPPGTSNRTSTQTVKAKVNLSKRAQSPTSRYVAQDRTADAAATIQQQQRLSDVRLTEVREQAALAVVREQAEQQRLMAERDIQASELQKELAQQRAAYEQQLDERDMEQVSR